MKWLWEANRRIISAISTEFSGFSYSQMEEETSNYHISSFPCHLGLQSFPFATLFFTIKLCNLGKTITIMMKMAIIMMIERWLLLLPCAVTFIQDLSTRCKSHIFLRLPRRSSIVSAGINFYPNWRNFHVTETWHETIFHQFPIQLTHAHRHRDYTNNTNCAQHRILQIFPWKLQLIHE